MVGRNQVQKVTPFNFLLQESLEERLCFLTHFPLHVFLTIFTFTFARLHLRWGAAHYTGILLMWADALQRGHPSNPLHAQACATL